MTLNETGDLLNKIKLYRPYFAGQFDKSGLDRLKREWHRILEPYEYEDINAELDDFLKDGDNLSKQPDVYQLIKYCKTKKQKKITTFKTTCKFCNRIMDYSEIPEHEDRCRSIAYLKKLYKDYFPTRDLPLKKLYGMSNDEFDDNYYKILEIVNKQIEPSSKEAKLLTNVLETRKGNKEKYKIKDLEKEEV